RVSQLSARHVPGVHAERNRSCPLARGLLSQTLHQSEHGLSLKLSKLPPKRQATVRQGRHVLCTGSDASRAHLLGVVEASVALLGAARAFSTRIQGEPATKPLLEGGVEWALAYQKEHQDERAVI